MAIQSHLSIETRKIEGFKAKKKPSHLFNWEKMKPILKRFLLLHIIQGITGHPQKHLSIYELSTTINRNTTLKSQNREGIVKDQLGIYIENLIYYGFIDESYSKGLVLNDKIYDELQKVDRIITGNIGEVEK